VIQIESCVAVTGKGFGQQPSELVRDSQQYEKNDIVPSSADFESNKL
jgi:hypothetical protein